MVRWVVGSILHGVDPLSYFSFQPVLHDWCNKGCGMCYPVCGMVLNDSTISDQSDYPSHREQTFYHGATYRFVHGPKSMNRFVMLDPISCFLFQPVCGLV